MEPMDAMLLQNAKFYEAFEHGDIEAIAGVWAHHGHVKCIHPGWSLLVGWNDILQSWQNIFSSGVAMKFSLRDVRAEVYGRLGVVVLTEEITYVDGSVTHTGAIVATNLFEFDGNEWKIIHHHGSPLVSTQHDDSGTYKYN